MSERAVTEAQRLRGVRGWLVRHVPPRLLKAFWVTWLVLMVGGVCSAWVQVAIDANAARFAFACFWTLLLGIPAIDEWRHRDDILG